MGCISLDALKEQKRKDFYGVRATRRRFGYDPSAQTIYFI